MTSAAMAAKTVELRLRVEKDVARLDVFLSDHLEDLSRSAVQQLIAAGEVLVNGAPARASRRLEEGDLITVRRSAEERDYLTPEKLPLAIVYEDEDLLVVDKPAGLVVHPAPGHPRHTLANALVALRPALAGVGGPRRAGIAHRLDKDTSGLLMVAKNDRAHRHFTNQLRRRRMKKGYLALVAGHPDVAQAAIEAPVGRDPRHPERMAVRAAGREAKTAYRVLRRYRQFTLLEVSPETGRTHQIRVHLAALGHPVAGDGVYGRHRDPRLPRHFLHAHRLGLVLPDGQPLELTCELPPDLKAVLALLEAEEKPPRGASVEAGGT